MKKINEVSNVSGVSIRTLQYYDNIGLLKATKRTESGYRLYDDTALEQLQQILLFRELKFPLKEIKIMMSSPNFDKTKALNQQIKLLTLRKERLDNLIKFAREIKKKGGIVMDFKAFNTSEIQEYAKRTKAEWGNTSQYSEFIKKASNKTKEENELIASRFMQIFAKFGKLRNKDISSVEVQTQVQQLQNYITEHFYNCTKEILAFLGKMYVQSSEFKANIDNVGGDGTALFVSNAISEYCKA